MSDSRVRLADVVREVGAEDRGRPGPPPSLDALARYAAGELTEAEAERIRDDVVARPESREIVLALKAALPAEPPGDEYRITDREVEDAWHRMSAELGIAATPAPEAPKAARGKAPGPAPAWMLWLKTLLSRPATLPVAVAASLLLGIFVGPVGRREAPRLNVEVVDLVPEGDMTRSAETEVPNASRRGQPFLWILSSASLVEYSTFAVEVVDAGKRVVWDGRAEHPTAAGHLTLEVPPGYLAAGIYRVRLFGLRAGERHLLEEYAVRVDP